MQANLNQTQLSKLKWRCRRGTKELDIMLTRFIDKCIDELTDQQIRDFKRLLAEQDPELNHWLVEQGSPKDKGLSDIVQRIQSANNL